MRKYLCSLFEKCHSCSILGTLICVSGILITISIAALGYSFFQISSIESAKRDLDEIKKEYQSTLDMLKKVQDFSIEDYDSIDTDTFIHAYDSIEIFKNLYIATAIIATKRGSKKDALLAWSQATYINPNNMLCNYRLGIEYFKNARDSKDKSLQEDYFKQSIKYLSHETLSNHPQALYHLALSKLRYIDFQVDDKQKYDLAKQAIITLNQTDKSKHPIGNVTRNLAYAYYIAAKYSPDQFLAQKYRDKASIYCEEIHGLAEFEKFYKKYCNECIKSPQ